MFDPEGEIAFIDNARAVLEGRTVFLITHRPASLALAARVVRMERGGRFGEFPAVRSSEPVYYTDLTLPTSDLV